MKKNTIMMQLLTKIGVIIGIITVTTFLLGYGFVKIKFEEYQAEQIDNATSIVKFAMESTQNSANTIENMIERKLYASSKGITSELRGRSASSITMEELRVLADEWAVKEITLWERQGDDIVVTQSSDETQIGLSSKNWGYWFTAFNELMSLQSVTVDEGFAMDNYWVGPISKAELFDHIFYKFAYYYDGTTDFMVNPFIEDFDIYEHTFESGPSQIIENIIDEYKDMEEIAVINVSAWKKGESNQVIEPNTDLPVLYGTHTIALDTDGELFEQVLATKQNASYQFTHDGVTYKKIYKYLPNERVMTMVIDLTRKKQFELFLALIYIASIFILFISLYSIIRYIIKRHLYPLPSIVDHIQQMAQGDLSETLHVKEKNELGWLSQQVNEMTNKFEQLIAGVKEDSHALVVVSNLLSQQVHNSVKTMTETATQMTSESKDNMLEIELAFEKLQTLFRSLEESKLGDLSGNGCVECTKPIMTAVTEIQWKMTELERIMKDHTVQTTHITVMFYDTLQELNEAIQKMESLSNDLNNKIEVFKVRD
ncbi:HAMP domain-containing protein [Bacillus alkalisoli]|uniref:HAMP domain-containing protein n=1 Tax=Bacillus alkalisoli TaxID=2011008 RepID=UPI000C2330E6|nr:methyl-accepting chemotaxis protein [Bacillus alkalisoli]